MLINNGKNVTKREKTNTILDCNCYEFSITSNENKKEKGRKKKRVQWVYRCQMNFYN